MCLTIPAPALCFVAFFVHCFIFDILVEASASAIPSRRTLLLSSAASVCFDAYPPTTATASPPIHDAVECGDVLVEETAVPGAYQNACMGEPIRNIPMHQQKRSDLRILQGYVGPGSTGAAVWNSSILLKRLVEQMDCWKEQSVVELGCGTGLVSLTIKALGAQRVVATDGNAEVLERAAHSAQLNQLEIETHQLQWGLLDASDFAADWVVGSDLTYSPGNWPALADTMATIANYRVLYLTLAHTGFSEEMGGFLTVASSRSGLVVDHEYTNHVRAMLLERCLVSQDERKMVQEGRGVNVVVLRPA